MENEYYRGDTIVFHFSFANDNGEPIKFEVDDLIKCGAKRTFKSENYALIKELEIDAECDEIQIEFTPEETKDLQRGAYILELELTRNGRVETIYQDYIDIVEDVIR